MIVLDEVTKELLLSRHSNSKTYCLNVSISCFSGSHVFVLEKGLFVSN